MDLVRSLDGLAELVVQTLLDEADGEVGDVDADPAAIEALRGGDGSAATAEGIENYVAFVGAGLDDAFEQGFGLLRWVAEALLGLGVEAGISVNTSWIVRPHLAEVAFKSGEAFGFFRPMDKTVLVQKVELLCGR